MSIEAQNNKIESPFNNTIVKDKINFDFLTSDFLNEISLYLKERHKENEQQYEFFNTTKEEIESLLFFNKFWEIQKREQKRINKERKKIYENRFNVPSFKTKKELEQVLKDTRDETRKLDIEWTSGGRENIFLELEIEGLIEKQNKIRAVLKTKINNNFNSDLKKAKAYPIENLIQFNHSGFAKCLWHSEKTPSLKLYKNRNKCHCFAGCGDFDSIDVYMKLNNCSINEAINNLK